jgi:hypothetical protein
LNGELLGVRQECVGAGQAAVELSGYPYACIGILPDPQHPAMVKSVMSSGAVSVK